MLFVKSQSRRTSHASLVLALASVLSSAGCSSQVAQEEGEGEELPGVETLDEASDTAERPTNHGELPFQLPLVEELTVSRVGPIINNAKSKRYHAWNFEVASWAQIQLQSQPDSTYDGDEGSINTTRTRITLQKKIANRWTTIDRSIEGAADANGRRASTIDTAVGAGQYRVVVQGVAARTQGRFMLTLGCISGEACRSVCLLGDTFYNIKEGRIPGLTLLADQHVEFMAEQAGTVREDEEALIVDAVKFAYCETSSNECDVTNYLEALEKVDENYVERDTLVHVSGRRYYAYSYGAGDNTYGRIYDAETGERASNIGDGDIYECSAMAQPAAL